MTERTFIVIGATQIHGELRLLGHLPACLQLAVDNPNPGKSMLTRLRGKHTDGVAAAL